ncbi:MAG: Arc family DNA-binding protein [Treponema sp.]|jgi:hypothetical protein|nr:Arc family DNA-binding protein [Treponema sp.]
MKVGNKDEGLQKVTYRLPITICEQLETAAIKHRRSMNDELIVSLEEYFTFANMMSGISEKLLVKIEGLASEETDGDLSNMMAILIREAVDEREERFLASKIDENIEATR